MVVKQCLGRFELLLTLLIHYFWYFCFIYANYIGGDQSVQQERSHSHRRFPSVMCRELGLTQPKSSHFPPRWDTYVGAFRPRLTSYYISTQFSQTNLFASWVLYRLISPKPPGKSSVPELDKC